MLIKIKDLFVLIVIHLFPWLGSLLGGWCLVETFLPPHRYKAIAAVLTLLWAFLCYPLYCRISAQNGLDTVRIAAFYVGPGILGVIIASVLLLGWIPLLRDVLAALHPILQLALYPLLACLVWFGPVAFLIARRTPPRKD